MPKKVASQVLCWVQFGAPSYARVCVSVDSPGTLIWKVIFQHQTCTKSGLQRWEADSGVAHPFASLWRRGGGGGVPPLFAMLGGGGGSRCRRYNRAHARRLFSRNRWRRAGARDSLAL